MSLESTALILITESTAPVYFKRDGLNPVIDKIKAEVLAFKADISTDDGRKTIASFARKIASAKTQVDKLGKDLVSGMKEECKAIDQERARAWDEIEALQKQARKPLTDWEERDERRVAAHKGQLETIDALTVFQINPTASEVEHRLEIYAALADRDFEEFCDLAKASKQRVFAYLTNELASIKKADADRIELERLQNEDRIRKQKEREDAIAQEAAEKARIESEQKAKREADEAQRAAQAIIDEAERGRKEAEQTAIRQRESIEAAEKLSKITADKVERDRVDAEKKAEKEKAEAIQAEKDRQIKEAKNAEDAAAKREANKKHAAKINGEIVTALMDTVNEDGLSPTITVDEAKLIVTAIAKGLIPHVSIKY